MHGCLQRSMTEVETILLQARSLIRQLPCQIGTYQIEYLIINYYINAVNIFEVTPFIFFRYDFYLVSNVARQGTVSPCSYHVIYDDSTLEADKIHKITYKLCHMYFNWSGAIAMPAPCQYAHKLASITGVAYHAPASTKLEKVLHFL